MWYMSWGRSNKLTLDDKLTMNITTIIKGFIRCSIRKAGFDLYRINGRRTVIGSFAPYRYRINPGPMENYFIHAGYRSRANPCVFDDTVNYDDWQFEVYRFARELADEKGFRTVCDIGCGSGYKLMKFFRERETLGLDIPDTCKFLKSRYPGRKWLSCDFSNPPQLSVDLLIAADLIEHLPNPDLLLDFIERIAPRYIILSTPDRDLLGIGTHDGPPANQDHVREWNFTELHYYIGRRFDILEHFISNARQATQCILCTPRV